MLDNVSCVEGDLDNNWLAFFRRLIVYALSLTVVIHYRRWLTVCVQEGQRSICLHFTSNVSCVVTLSLSS